MLQHVSTAHVACLLEVPICNLLAVERGDGAAGQGSALGGAPK